MDSNQNAWWYRQRNVKDEREEEDEKQKTGRRQPFLAVDRSIPASSSWKQVSPRKTGLIRKILIFIHT